MLRSLFVDARVQPLPDDRYSEGPVRSTTAWLMKRESVDASLVGDGECSTEERISVGFSFSSYSNYSFIFFCSLFFSLLTRKGLQVSRRHFFPS